MYIGGFRVLFPTLTGRDATNGYPPPRSRLDQPSTAGPNLSVKYDTLSLTSDKPNMWCFGALILWNAFCPAVGAAESFTVLPQGPSGRIEIRYGLTGAFGYYGGFIREPDKDGASRILLEGDGKPAKTFKAILYADGCQFSVLSVNLLEDSAREATFECVPLSRISLRGRISQLPADRETLDVEIYYMAAWDHTFFNLLDGMVQMFSLGKAPLDAEGRFEIAIPDFSKDHITNERRDAYLQIVIREHTSWNIVGWAVPPPDLRYSAEGLRILPSYAEIPFETRR